jgi:hypothetical protein
MRISQAEYDALVARGCLPPLNKPTARKSPYKSKAEQQYAWELEDKKNGGTILWWAYEPITLVIVEADGKRCRYTPDFLVVRETALLMTEFIFIEVKGFTREAARIRFLAARERYPFFQFRMVRKTKGGGFEDIL